MRRLLRFTLLILAAVAALGLSASAAPYSTFETITVAGTAIGITDAILDPPGMPQMTRCTIRIETAEIRARWDGGTPTSSVGHPVEPLEQIILENHADADTLLMIRTSGTSATASVTCTNRQ